jgi:hypothetical protein
MTREYYVLDHSAHGFAARLQELLNNHWHIELPLALYHYDGVPCFVAVLWRPNNRY